MYRVVSDCQAISGKCLISLWAIRSHANERTSPFVLGQVKRDRAPEPSDFLRPAGSTLVAGGPVIAG
jgi:hypothetical protein